MALLLQRLQATLRWETSTVTSWSDSSSETIIVLDRETPPLLGGIELDQAEQPSHHGQRGLEDHYPKNMVGVGPRAQDW